MACPLLVSLTVFLELSRAGSVGCDLGQVVTKKDENGHLLEPLSSVDLIVIFCPSGSYILSSELLELPIADR